MNSTLNEEFQFKNGLDARFRDTGARDKAKSQLRKRLYQCGWKEEMKAHCRELIENQPLEEINVAHLTNQITAKGKLCIPETVQSETLEQIRAFVTKEMNSEHHSYFTEVL